MERRRVDDERLRLADQEACGEIYRALLEYVRDPGTRLGESWGPPRVPTVYQYQMDSFDSEGNMVDRAEMDFVISLSAIRRRDGVDCYTTRRIPVRVKVDWPVLRENFALLVLDLESFSECACTAKVACARHQPGVWVGRVLSIQ